MAIPLGNQSLFEIDTNPTGTASYARIGDGIVSATPSIGQAVDKKGYLSGNGGMNTEVTGFDYTIAFAGDFKPSDTALAYIYSKLFDVGDALHTNMRQTGADGTVITGLVTITMETVPGGDANSTQAFGFTVNFAGLPTRVAPVAATAEAGDFAAGTVTNSTKFTPTTPAAGTNHLAYRLSTAAVTSNNREYIANAITYTSAANITGVAATQYLSIWELDIYNHVVFFVCSILTGVVGT